MERNIKPKLLILKTVIFSILVQSANLDLDIDFYLFVTFLFPENHKQANTRAPTNSK